MFEPKKSVAMNDFRTMVSIPLVVKQDQLPPVKLSGRVCNYIEQSVTDVPMIDLWFHNYYMRRGRSLFTAVRLIR